MDRYKWDLRKIFKNEKEFFDAIDKIKENVKNIIKYKGKIKENLYSLLELQSQTDLLIDKVYVY
ncbi:oligoendopeptidase F, partial [Xanthomonas citri pv. citri]|nr:oligoendopeptidase F [Xanthomonas citri pv. citri]